MAFNAAMASKSPTAAHDVFKEHIGLRRTLSGQDLVVKGRGIQRSSSDNHLCYHHSGNTNKNRIFAVSVGPGQGLKNSRSVGVFPFQIPNPIKSLLSHPDTFQDEKVNDQNENETNLDGIKKANLDSIKKADLDGIKKANWVERLLEIRRQWKKEVKTETLNGEISAENLEEEDEDVCVADYGSENGDWERESFSRLLVKASWSEAKKLSQLAYLCNVAYTIPEIKAEDLKKYYGLTFVTSSLEKKAKAAILREKLEQDSTRVPVVAIQKTKLEQPRVSSSASAYKIAASAASYIHSCKEYGYEEELGNPVYKSAAAAQAAASTMTAVVAAGEEEKLEAAKELQSLQSSPCEWFVCDDPNTCTRCFVIQGSDSLASWKANLFFEPTKFEDTDVLVHRGIYEAAKGIYEQFLPEITEHVSRHGSDRAKFQFTGHSLGGSLSLIVNLMLLTRGILTIESMKPVVTFGSPFVFCGGEKILEEVLGVDHEDHVHCVMMHRDIVPRAFACNYPDHVATVLKRLNGSFRTHPCLNTNKLLYSPMGKVFILQPSESVSPTHPFLPSGNALYVLDKSKETYSPTALRAFLNRPHPLETLSQRAAYGSEGSVLRDHDSKNYVKAVNGVLRQHTKLIVRKVRRQRRSNVWPVLTSAERNMTLMTTATEEIMTRV